MPLPGIVLHFTALRGDIYVILSGACKVLSLHLLYPTSIPGPPYGSPSTLAVITVCKTKSHPWTTLV